MIKKIPFIVGLVFALAYTFFCVYIIVSEYNSTGFLYNISSFAVALPWAKLWDFGGTLAGGSHFIKAILNPAGAVINSGIIFFAIKFIVKKIIILLFMGKENNE